VLGQLADLAFTLKPGASAEIIVTASAPVVDTSQTSVSSVIGQEQIDSLPTNGRNFLSFSVLTPGVTTDRTPQQGASATSGLTFGGQRARSNNIMVDGLDNNDPIVGSVRATFSQEAVREFQVVTNQFAPEFGVAGGGLVNVVSRSGTNDYHGNLFYFMRNESLDGRNAFSPDSAKPQFRRKNSGSTQPARFPLQLSAIFQNGCFRPLESVDLPENSRVYLNIIRSE
jgi:hypothetical protein